MADSVHLKLTNETDGKPVDGETSKVGLAAVQGMIECTYFEHLVEAPWESGKAMTVGGRRHKPVLIRKRIDQASPLLLELMKNSTKLKCEFTFHRPGRTINGDHDFYCVTLTGARIASLRTYVADSYVEKDKANLAPLEEVSFMFTDIMYSFKHEDGGAVSGTDTWAA